MKNAHFDPDLGHFHIHIDDNADLEIHRDSPIDGHTMMPLGIDCAVLLARDILTYSGQADATTVQRIADTIEALADEGHHLSATEMRQIVSTLRCGVIVPVVRRPSNVVVQFRPRTAAVQMQGMVG